MRDAANRKGVGRAVGLQGQVSPAINYTKDLIAEGFVGRVLSATMIGCAPNWGPSIDRAYQADFANGANLLTITGGHPQVRTERDQAVCPLDSVKPIDSRRGWE